MARGSLLLWGRAGGPRGEGAFVPPRVGLAEGVGPHRGKLSTVHTRRIERDFNGQAAERSRAIADNLNCRLWWFAWWRAVQREHPGGVVGVDIAAQMLGVTRKRVRELIKAGRLPRVDVPGGTDADVLVPVDSLLAAPNRLHTGRKLLSRGGHEAGDPINPYVETLSTPKKQRIFSGLRNNL